MERITKLPKVTESTVGQAVGESRAVGLHSPCFRVPDSTVAENKGTRTSAYKML